MNQILYGLPFIIGGIFQLYNFIIIIYCVMTFIPRLYQSSVGQIIVRLVEPFFNAIKKVIPTTFGMIDFSPLIALLILELAQKVIFWII